VVFAFRGFFVNSAGLQAAHQNYETIFIEICLGSNWQEKLTIVAEIALFCLKGLPQHG
jgi:hypothetical protein